MKVQCPKCKAFVKSVDPASAKDGPVVVCPKCKNVFFLDGPGQEVVETEVYEADKPGITPDIYTGRSRQLKRYMAWLWILLAVVVFYQFVQAARQSELIDQSRTAAAGAALKELAAAQELYRLDSNRYAESLEQIADYFQPPDKIEMRIVRSNSNSWAAEASHIRSETIAAFDSDVGKVSIRIPDEEE